MQRLKQEENHTFIKDISVSKTQLPSIVFTTEEKYFDNVKRYFHSNHQVSMPELLFLLSPLDKKFECKRRKKHSVLRQHRQEQKIEDFSALLLGVRGEDLFLNQLTNDISRISSWFTTLTLELGFYSYLWRFGYSSLFELSTNRFANHTLKHHMIY